MAAASLPKDGCSWRSNTRRKRCTACTDTVRRWTVSEAVCKKESGNLQIVGFGPGIAASFPRRDLLGEFNSFYSSVAPTATLFVKRTT
jgi:hypothetical protein